MITNNTDEILLLRSLKAGDEAAFKCLFETYFVSLCRFMNLYLKNKMEVEEIALDIFMYIWTHREEIRITISLKAYLFQAARNRCLNALRDQKEVCYLEELNDILKEGERIDTDLELKELNHLIEEAICSLPDKCKEVFLRSRKQNLTNKEISDKMQISVKTVEAQITKALKHIREHLNGRYTYLF